MDESWRMRMGMPTPKLPNYPPRRSTGNTASHHRKPIPDDDPLNPEDFTDVFGGPPRTILSRQFSAGGNPPRSSSSTGFSYRDIFRQPEKAASEAGGGRKLPQFNIPFGKQRSLNHADQRGGFYGDVFGWDNHIDDHESVVRSRSRSKTSSSSVLSSEELSPLRPAISDDGYDDVYLFGSKLRPINVMPRSKSNRMLHEDNFRRPFADQSNICNISEIDFFGNTKNFPFGSSRRNASPESINIEPMSTSMSFRKSPDELKFNSPCSPASSVCHSDIETTKACDDEIVLDEELQEEDDDDDEMMSSYVIEFDIGNKEWTSCGEPNGVDEAIAWAKEKFQTYNSLEDNTTQELVNELQLSKKHAKIFQDDKKDVWPATEEMSKAQVEIQILNEKIRLWSTGKEADIRLLLSSLHHILWDNSGWVPIPLMNIIESSQVKKAYQKAQLCLHPDKLQQRGATVMQKYIAEKVFSALQDAWAAFISQDALCSTKPDVSISPLQVHK
ncbi:j domain-containing protein required for chloroplast accumulation response 1 [Phtheirospermum japonicum]|uniref:J domain-containing protein required for chloroplast accumulation response 1 n=1 Tax=Phtheirospermum japonicum TaxID=374723 RepID=A0A830DJG2_9LAMI|nr:j domain-containing protein required for chloroplast accumulation response 1 [Phtheirospermum japonicum]